MSRVKKAIGFGLLGIFFAVAAGCATKQHHDLYQGESGQAAVLKSSETVLIEMINGREVGPSFIGQVHSYELAPGEYTILVSYSDLYDIDADNFDKVDSDPVKLTFNLSAGGTYQVTHREISGLSDAKAFAKKPVIKVKDVASGDYVSAAVEYVVPKRLLPQLVFGSDEEKVFASDYVEPASPPTEAGAAPDNAAEGVKPVKQSDLSALKMLQFSWQNASQEERDAFLRWVEEGRQ